MRVGSGSCHSRATGRPRGRTALAVAALHHDDHFESPSTASAACRFPSASTSGQNWRAFRAHLCAWEAATKRTADRTAHLQRPPYPALVAGNSWAHELAEVEQGCLLLATPKAEHFFNQAVVLVTSHDAATGTVGYAINKPSPLKVGELQVLGAASGFMEAFSQQRLYLGGPVHLDHLTICHRYMGASRTHEITEGVYMGGLPDAIRLVNSGIAPPTDFQLILGMSGWAAGQLEAEIKAGYWTVVAASPDLVLPSSPGACPAPQQQPDAEGQQGPAPRSSGPSPMYKRIARLALRGV